MKVGSVCTFHVLGIINFDDYQEPLSVPVLVSAIDHLSFEKKGFFCKLKDFYVNDRESNIDQFVQS